MAYVYPDGITCSTDFRGISCGIAFWTGAATLGFGRSGRTSVRIDGDWMAVFDDAMEDVDEAV